MAEDLYPKAENPKKRKTKEHNWTTLHKEKQKEINGCNGVFPLT